MNTRYIAIAVGSLLYIWASPVSAKAIRLQLKWLHQFQFAGYYAAVEKGYYADAGLQVELIEPTFERDTMQIVLDGDAEYGVSNPDILLLRAKGEPVVALASIFQHSPHALLALEDSAFKTVHDLKNKRIMMEPGSAELFALLKAEQIPVESLDIVPHSFEKDALIEGAVDALSVYVTDEPYELALKGYKTTIFSPRSAGIDFYGDGLFTTESRIREHPEEVAAFLSASLKGWEYALRHPEEIADLILAQYSQRKSREALLYEAAKTKDLIRPDLVEIGYMHAGRWEHMLQVFKQVGLIKGEVNVEDILYKNYLQAPSSLLFKLIAGCLVIIAAILGLNSWKHRQKRRELEDALAKKEVTEQFLRDREEEYRTLFRDAPLPFIVWDTDLRVKYWNNSAKRQFGWSFEEVKGRSAAEFIVPSSEITLIQEIRSKLKSDASVTISNKNLTKDGRTIVCDWNNIPCKDATGQVVEFHSIAVDITKQIQQRSALEAENQNIRSKSDEKERILAITSHEIRNPLNAIMGFAQILLEEATDDEVKSIAKIMVDGADNILSVLNDLLDSSKIEAGQMTLNLNDIDLSKLVRSRAELFEGMILKKDIQLNTKVPSEACFLRTDEQKVRQIIDNLLSNALKFTPTGIIQLSLIRESDTTCRIVLKDTGIGMDAEALQSIFEPFRQANSSISSEFGGTGLGLSLSKRLASLLNGSLSAESEEGVGSTFTLILNPVGVELAT